MSLERKMNKKGDAGVGSENQVPRLVDRRRATQMMNYGDRRRSHVPSRTGV